MRKSSNERSSIQYDRKYGSLAYGCRKSNVNAVGYDKYCGKKFPEPSKVPPIKDKLKEKTTKNLLGRPC